MGRPYKCPYCGQSESVGKGVRKTKTMGDRRIRLCKACDRKFTPKNQKAGEDLPTPSVVVPTDTVPMPVDKPDATSPPPAVKPGPVQTADSPPAAAAAPADGKSV